MIESEGEEVWGLVYEVTSEDLKALDDYKEAGSSRVRKQGHQEAGSGLAITQRLEQSTIMPWPLRLACAVAVNQATGRRPFREAERRTV